MKLDRLSSVYRQIKERNETYSIFPFTKNNIVFDVFFDIETNPFRLGFLLVQSDFQMWINLRGLGLLASGQNPILADNLKSPYANAHALYVNIPAISYHSSTIGGNSILPDIWTYMLIAE